MALAETMTGGATLVVQDIVAGYGDVTVLRGVSLAARPGTVTAVLGPNGAGKTTLLGAVAGLVRIQSGKVLLREREIQRLPAYKRSPLGISLVQEGKRVFRRRSVHENLLLGSTSLNRHALHQAAEQAYERFPMLAARRHVLAGSLSGGQQQMLAIAQALVGSPDVLMLDEPSAGLAPVIVNDVLSLIGRLREEGLAIVLVEQLVEQTLAVADHVIVLRAGTVVIDAPRSDFHDSSRIRDAYLSAE